MEEVNYDDYSSDDFCHKEENACGSEENEKIQGKLAANQGGQGSEIEFTQDQHVRLQLRRGRRAAARRKLHFDSRVENNEMQNGSLQLELPSKFSAQDDRNVTKRSQMHSNSLVSSRMKTKLLLSKLLPRNGNFPVANYLSWISLPGGGEVLVDRIPVSDLKVRVQRPKVKPEQYILRSTSVSPGSLLSNGGLETSRNDEVAYKMEKLGEDLRQNVSLFLDRMHEIQGDKRFSRWKGSVVDSIVGAFLTQNVNDHLSSSAFLSLRSFAVGKTMRENCDAPTSEDTHPTLPKSDDSTATASSSGIQRANLEASSGGRKLPRVSRGKQSGGELPSPRDWSAARTSMNSAVVDLSTVGEAVDWSAVAGSPLCEIATAIQGRGMNFVLAGRIKAFLQRTVSEFGAIDLEWLRAAPPLLAQEYLSSIHGLGSKSCECVRLLCLHQKAFPVDTNVGRVCVRLGWVPLQPLPEDVQLHLLEQYPLQASIQQYLWPFIEAFSHEKLYELHCQLITFGKVFCTKLKPNCAACPMRDSCHHFQSQQECATPIPPDSSLPALGVSSPALSPVVADAYPPALQIEDIARQRTCHQLVAVAHPGEQSLSSLSASESDCRTTAFEGNAACPVHFRDDRLHTVHYAYELPSNSPVLELSKLPLSVAGEPCPYLLAVTCPAIEDRAGSPLTTCKMARGFHQRRVKGTFLYGCRSAVEGSFPLNGTYFQSNEVFADHASSVEPVEVPWEWLAHLQQRPVYFGSSMLSIARGLSSAEVTSLFWTGFVCTRGFDLLTQRPQPLSLRLHTARKGVKADGD